MLPDNYNTYLRELPEDWLKVPIAQLGTIFSGGTPGRLIPDFWNGMIPWVTPGEITDMAGKYLTTTRDHITEAGLANCAAKLLPAGSLLVTTRATIGSVAIAGIEVCTNQGFKNIVPNASSESEFYYYLIQFIAYEMRRLASGSTFDEISRRDFASIVVPQPPLTEQRHIATILDSIDAHILASEQLIAKLRQVKKGLLHELLACGIDEHGQVRDPLTHPERFQDSPLGRIPKEWEITTLGALVTQAGGTIQTGPFGSQLHAHEYVHDGIPVIMPQDIQDGSVSTDQIAHIPSVKAEALARHRVQHNDVIFARRGELSRAATIGVKEIGWVCGTGCLLVRLPTATISGAWLAKVYQHSHSQQQILARAVGLVMKNLNTALLAGIVLAKSPYAEQKAIIEALDAHDTRIASEEAHLNKLRQVKQALMDDLLTGRVRVRATEEAPVRADGAAR